MSQICIFTFRSPTSTILEPNSTPMVVSLSRRNFPSRNCINAHDFPTPAGRSRRTRVADYDVLQQVAVRTHPYL